MAGCCCKSRYMRQIDAAYPATAGEGLNRDAARHLTFFALSNPRKLPKMARYLTKKIAYARDRGYEEYVVVGAQIYEQLITACHAQMALFVEPFFSAIEHLLEADNLVYQQSATTAVRTGIRSSMHLPIILVLSHRLTQSMACTRSCLLLQFERFASLQTQTVDYVRHQDFLIAIFSSMCFMQADEVSSEALYVPVTGFACMFGRSEARDCVRAQTGMQGLRSILSKASHGQEEALLWNKSNLLKIVHAVLRNMSGLHPHARPADALVDQRVENGEQAKSCLTDLLLQAGFNNLRAVLDLVVALSNITSCWIACSSLCKNRPPLKFAALCLRQIRHAPTDGICQTVEQAIDALIRTLSAHRKVEVITFIMGRLDQCSTEVEVRLLSLAASVSEACEVRQMSLSFHSCPPSMRSEYAHFSYHKYPESSRLVLTYWYSPLVQVQPLHHGLPRALLEPLVQRCAAENDQLRLLSIRVLDSRLRCRLPYLTALLDSFTRSVMSSRSNVSEGSRTTLRAPEKDVAYFGSISKIVYSALVQTIRTITDPADPTLTPWMDVALRMASVFGPQFTIQTINAVLTIPEGAVANKTIATAFLAQFLKRLSATFDLRNLRKAVDEPSNLSRQRVQELLRQDKFAVEYLDEVTTPFVALDTSSKMPQALASATSVPEDSASVASAVYSNSSTTHGITAEVLKQNASHRHAKSIKDVLRQNAATIRKMPVRFCVWCMAAWRLCVFIALHQSQLLKKALALEPTELNLDHLVPLRSITNTSNDPVAVKLWYAGPLITSSEV
ncbi:uncharacterized protein MONBRDRAFT_9121 [Monosiga brevicollis MX1]|uniref:Uncharacterized protein n=1 Tax=Monosiga brevicollis TaxID=81824 RepID=A9V254_MONBE|nr:uncharacterized protein MONBRDRAFT_9121 [Monosiga brevicollis MX1]EDQ88321.1 predicted protein [Monosiga brevicollis MX1]|eukprot:XP_001746914.1 hypothetical protein [Monosiga brevicollis MX1]